MYAEIITEKKQKVLAHFIRNMGQITYIQEKDY